MRKRFAPFTNGRHGRCGHISRASPAIRTRPTTCCRRRTTASTAPGRSWPACSAREDSPVADLTCLREEELLEALSDGREPLGELATHVAACPSCSELALVAGAILDDRNLAMREAAVPPSGAV